MLGLCSVKTRQYPEGTAESLSAIAQSSHGTEVVFQLPGQILAIFARPAKDWI